MTVKADAPSISELDRGIFEVGPRHVRLDFLEDDVGFGVAVNVHRP